MLSSENRLVDAELFRTAVRRGRRSGGRILVAHLLVPDAAATGDQDPPRVGFVVSKAVGTAVVRNRVKRRLRHQAREHVPSLPGSAVLVVRALPEAANATATELAAELDRCLHRALR